MASNASRRIRVAIIGGGLGGAALANVLAGLSHLEVQVFESKPTFSERGASIGLASNAIDALGLIIPSVDELLARAGAVLMHSTRVILGSGPRAGEMVLDLPTKGPGKSVHRGALLQELLAPLPDDLLHSSKKLKTILRMEDGSMQITFDGETTFDFDAVIGADGIFGSTRAYVLNDPTGKYGATPAGFWDCMRLVSIETAKEYLGEDQFKVFREYGWVGDGALILLSAVDDGAKAQCIISGVEPDPGEERKRPISRDFLNKVLHQWLDGPIAMNMINLVLDQDDACRYSQWEQKETPTYYNGRTCLVGDAAHASTPWQGSGACMAIEDAFVLGKLFRHVQNPEQIEAAFKAFETVRKPRCQRIIDSSHATGDIICGQVREVGQDPEKLRKALSPRWAFIHDVNLEQDAHEAVEKMKSYLER